MIGDEASAAGGGDPFATGELRRAVLASWRDSGTRFREDANAEEDLRYSGYRDRLFVELAQNAADAAAQAGVSGVLRLTLADGELQVANTGAQLDAAGVAALASLRASAKRTGETVGRFGVGFAAVLAVADEIEVVSRTGGVAFSAARTRAAAEEIPELADELTERSGAVPVLRLAWPVAAVPPAGFDTEVRLRLRADLDEKQVVADCVAQVPDVLLALPALGRIEIGDRVWRREDTAAGAIVHAADGEAQRWLLSRTSGELAADDLVALGSEARKRPQWTVCWAVPLAADGTPQPLPRPGSAEVEILHAPTATDERLSLPARLIATLPIDASRRRVQPGSAADLVLAEAAAHYPVVLTALPPELRTELVPAPGFPLSEVDDKLRAGIMTALRRAEWLPGAAGKLLSPDRAVVLDSGPAALAELLADLVPGLLAAEFAAPRHATALAALEVRRLRAAELADALGGVEREPSWWHSLYDALADLVEGDPSAAAELGALPVPLADGRTVTGPRDVLLPETDAELMIMLSTMDEFGLRIVDPVAAHPLLERLGARPAGPVELLAAPALREAVERSVDDAEAGLDVAGLADAVLLLVDRAGVRPGEQPWLGALALPDSAGDLRRADELLLPSSPLLTVFGEDMPLGVLAEHLAQRWPASLLTALGIVESWSVLTVDEPAGPDHELADEAEWWAQCAEERPPARLVAVRDLELVDDEAWPAALRSIFADPRAKRALDEPNGYTAWWLARYARLAGHAPREWRLTTATGLAGLCDPAPEVGLPAELLAAIGVRSEFRVTEPTEAQDLLDRLADPAREVAGATVLAAHRELAEAVLADSLDPSAVDLPERVRTLAGRTVAAEDAVVLDGPWLLAVLDPDRVVGLAAGPDELDLVDALAELLELPLAVEDCVAEPSEPGVPTQWAQLPGVATVCALLAIEVPADDVRLHDTLTISHAGRDVPAPWWVDDDQHVHTDPSAAGLARALCWRIGRWDRRHLAAALLAAPTAETLLG